MTAEFPDGRLSTHLLCRNNGSGGHRESFVKTFGIFIPKSSITYAMEMWNRMLGLRNPARFFRREREKEREQKKYCKRFLSGVEVTRVKNRIVTVRRGGERRIVERKKKKIIVIWVPRSEQGDDLFRVREETGVRAACSVTRCLKIHEIRA